MPFDFRKNDRVLTRFGTGVIVEFRAINYQTCLISGLIGEDELPEDKKFVIVVSVDKDPAGRNPYMFIDNEVSPLVTTEIIHALAGRTEEG